MSTHSSTNKGKRVRIKLKDGKISALAELVLSDPKTKILSTLFKKLGLSEKTLLLVKKTDRPATISRAEIVKKILLAFIQSILGW